MVKQKSLSKPKSERAKASLFSTPKPKAALKRQTEENSIYVGSSSLVTITFESHFKSPSAEVVFVSKEPLLGGDEYASLTIRSFRDQIEKASEKNALIVSQNLIQMYVGLQSALPSKEKADLSHLLLKTCFPKSSVLVQSMALQTEFPLPEGE